MLLVEDDRTLSEMYAALLTAGDFTVATAFNGAQSFDLIVLDVMMPGLSGIDVLKQLKADPKTKDVPMVAFSNLANETVAAEMLRLGALKYLVKSDVERVLRADIKKCLTLRLVTRLKNNKCQTFSNSR